MLDRVRQLIQGKANKPSRRARQPLDREGAEGDFVLTRLKDGIFIFFKGMGKWLKIFHSRTSLIPDKTKTYDLGSQTRRWKNLYLSNNALHIGDTKELSAKITSDGDDLKIIQKGTTAERPIISADGAWIDIGGDQKNKNFLLEASSASGQARFTHSKVSATSLFYFITSLNAAAFDNYIRLKDNSDPGTPASGYGYLYAKSDSLHYKNDSAGVIDLVAGNILGYTDIGLGEALATYNLTTSYAVPTSEFAVTFTVPPSEKVEISIQIACSMGSSNVGDVYAGLSDNATYNTIADFHEVEIFDSMSRGAWRTLTHTWTLGALLLPAVGTEETIWVGFKSTSTTGTPLLSWGGDATNLSPDFIMKAIALPASIST